MKGLSAGPPLHTFQMLGPERPPAEDRDESCHSILMTSEDAGEMFELITLAFPGFYQPRTYEMGTYYGIRVEGRLVAMAGERLCMTGYREISGVCTHPAHTGKGYARTLMHRLMRDNAAAESSRSCTLVRPTSEPRRFTSAWDSSWPDHHVVADCAG